MNKMEELTNQLMDNFRLVVYLWDKLEAENERLRAYIADLEKKIEEMNEQCLSD